MKLILLSLLLALANLRSGHSQEYRSLSLTVRLSETVPASFAKIKLFNLRDSSVQILQADENGNCTIQIQDKRDHRVEVEYLGYQIFSKELTEIQLNAGKLLVTLRPNNITLGEVVVKADRPLIQRLGEKLVLNVTNIVELGSELPLLEILNYAPGVIVDNGTIILNGKPGVKMTIDGRDLPNFSINTFSNIVSSNIKTVEIIQNPSAQYDASGAAGIINIVTKKNLGKLLQNTTTTSVSQAERVSYTVANSLVVSTGKLLLNQAFSLQRSRPVSEKSYQQVNTAPGNFSSLAERSRDSVEVSYPTASLDLDYIANNNQTVTAGFTLFGSKRETIQESVQRLDYVNSPYQQGNFSGLAEGKILNTAAYLGLSSRLDTNGSTRKLFIHYTTFDNSSTISNATKLADMTSFTNGRFENSISLLTANLDYNKVLNRQSSVRYGLKYAYSLVDNFSEYLTRSGSASNSLRDFDFDEQIGAGYLDYTRQLKYFDYTIGGRAEFTAFKNTYKQDQLNPLRVEKEYMSFFPSFNVNYTKDPNHILSFFGGRRINRPLYDFLSPFVQVRNNYSYSEGNPELKPMYAYNLGLSYLVRQQYSVSLAYSFIDQVFASIQRINQASGSVVYSIGNLNSQQDLSLSVSAPFAWGEKLSFNTSVNLFYNKFESPDELTQISQSGKLAFNTFLSARYRPTNRLTLSSSHYYFTGSYQSQLRSFPRSYLNVVTRYSLVPDRASMTLAFNDLLYKNNYKEQFKFEESFIESFNRSDTRSLQLGFSYRFGKLKPANAITSKPQNDELSRIKSQ